MKIYAGCSNTFEGGGFNVSHLEFDPDKISLIEPTDINQPLDVPEYCIICFFGEVIEIITSEFNAKILVENRWEDGPHRLFEIEYQ